MIPISRLQTVLSSEVAAALSDDGEGTPPPQEILQEMLQISEEEVRETLGVGSQDLSPLLEDIAVTLAVERLFLRRREMIPGLWGDRAERCRRLLKEMLEGRHPGFNARERRITGTIHPPQRRNPALGRW